MQLRTEKVSPDVAGLGVDSEDTLEAGGDRLEFGSVSAVEVLVVLHPERQRGVTDRLPAAPPHAQHKVLRSAQHTTHHRHTHTRYRFWGIVDLWCVTVSIHFGINSYRIC